MRARLGFGDRRVPVSDVFVCHASDDRLIAESAVVALEARGYQCWIAPRDVPPGTDYANAILAGISDSRVLLLIFSHRANQSPHVPREVERAVHRGMSIIPFRLDEVEPTGPLEYFISGAQWLDATAGQPEDHLPSLVDAITDLIGTGAPAPAPRGFSDEVRSVLRDVVYRYGTDLTRDPRRLQAVLRDMVGEHRAEISALVVAAEEGVPDSLLQSSDIRATMGRLAQRLQDYRALGEAAAWWAVEGWASALRLVVQPEPAGADPGIATVPIGAEQPEAPTPEVPTEVRPAPEPPTAPIESEEDTAPSETVIPQSLEPETVPPASPGEPPQPRQTDVPRTPPQSTTPGAPAGEPEAAPSSEATPPTPLEDSTPTVEPEAVSETEPTGRKRWLVGVALVAVVAAGGVAAATLLGGDDGSTPGDTAATTSTSTTSEPTSSPTTVPVAGGDGGLQGTSVTVYGTDLSEEQTIALADALAPFSERSGIDVAYTPLSDLPAEVNAVLAAGDPLDIVIFDQPGVVADLVRRGEIVAVPGEVTSAVGSQWPANWMSFGTVDGRQFAIPVQSALKSLVWFKPSRFADLGYEVPDTWENLRALSDRAIADGVTPWCVGIQSGEGTGWVFTDWVEDLTLRLFGPDFYDQWVAHDVPFNTPEMAAVWQEVIDVWSTPGAVYGGIGSITSTWYFETGALLAEDLCLMVRQGSFYPSWYPVQGEAIEAFFLPGVTGERPALVSGSVAAAFRDRPEVWAVMEYLGSAEYAEERQRAQARLTGEFTGFLTANTAVDRSVFHPVEQGFIEILVEASLLRFDGSDQMPPEVGTGSFWSEATRLVDGERSVDEALESIETTWP